MNIENLNSKNIDTFRVNEILLEIHESKMKCFSTKQIQIISNSICSSSFTMIVHSKRNIKIAYYIGVLREQNYVDCSHNNKSTTLYRNIPLSSHWTSKIYIHLKYLATWDTLKDSISKLITEFDKNGLWISNFKLLTE